MTELKPGWRRVKFGEVVRLNKETCKDPEAAGIERVIGLEHLEPGDLQVRAWSDVADGTTFTNRVRPGQVLFGKRRAYQRKVAVADFDAVCSGDIYVLESADPERLLPDLLPFICQSDKFFEHAVGTSAGSLSPRTNWKSLSNYELMVPPPGDQARLAEQLNIINLAAGRGKEVIKSLQIVVASLLEDAIAGVQFCQLEDMCELITDGEHATPPREEKGIYLISARNVRDGSLDLSSVDYISPGTYERLSRRIEPAWGDVLLSCSGTVGRSCCVPRDTPMAMVRSVALIRPDPRNLNHEFLSLFLRAPRAQQQIRSLTNQTAQGNLFQASIRRIKIPSLPIDIQLLLVRRAKEAFDSIGALNQRHGDLEKLHSRLLSIL
jgi:type I restriction enzyme S subunit